MLGVTNRTNAYLDGSIRTVALIVSAPIILRPPRIRDLMIP